MRRLVLLFLCLAAAACGERDSPAQPEERSKVGGMPLPELAPPAAAPAEEAPEREGGEDAAAVLRLYYQRIGERKYDSAYQLREGEPSEAERARFAANFAAYGRYRATVGQASEPVDSGGYTYVEVPVMLYGAFRNGKPFASSGSVTLRRPASGGPWRIFTGGGRSGG